MFHVISGLLFLPVIRFFLDSLNSTIKVHGFGSVRDVVDGLALCCASEATVVAMGEAGIYLMPFSEHPAFLNKQRIKMADFNYLGKKDKHLLL